MKNILIFSFILFSFCFIKADDGLISVNGAIEIEAGLTGPGQAKSFLVSIINNNSADVASSVIMGFSNTDFDFLGGVYPGLGGDCSGSLGAGASCNLMIEHAPLASGDSDDMLNVSYNLMTTTLGSAHSTDLLIDGQSELTMVSGCSALAPVVSNVSPNQLNLSTTSQITLSGFNFSVATSINVSGLSVSNINIINAENLTFDLQTTSTTANYNLEVQNECGSTIVNNAISVAPSTWIDLRNAAGVAVANPDFTTAEINGYTVDPSFGMQLDVASTGWNKFLRFDGVCDAVSKDFDIVIYRAGTATAFMPALWASTTAINPYPDNLTYRRQYIGFWYSGGASTSAWGSQGGEGGSNWNQSFTSISMGAGKFYRFTFRQAAQSGQTYEVREVDSSLNDIQVLATITSNKASAPASNVCAGITAYSGGLSDYYITAVRAL